MDVRKDYFQTSLDYRRPGQGYSSGAACGAATEEGAKDALMLDYQYYTDLGDVQIVKAEIRRVCDGCNGNGKVRRGKRVIKMVRCPSCRGKDSDILVESWVNLPKALMV